VAGVTITASPSEDTAATAPPSDGPSG